MATEDDVRAVIERWAEAVRNVDTDGVLAHHTDDIVMFDVPPPVQSRGREAYRKTWELFFESSSGGEGAFDLHELAVTADEKVAFAHALVDVAGTTARLTIGLKKIGSEWFIAHEHHSYPLAPAEAG